MVRFRSVVLSSSSQPNVVKGSYQWNDYLEKILTKVNESGEGDNRISEYVVPAECFFEAPFVEFARYIVKNLKVEVALEDDTASLLADESISLFWVASVQKVAGYRVLVRFEGMDQVGDESNDVWINLGSAELRHVGFCSEDINTRVLVPPPEIAGRQSDWSHYLMCQLHAYKTLPVSWPELQHRKINCCKFKKGDRVELLDSLVSMRVRPAVVEDVVGGRIFLKISAKDMNKADMQVKEDDDEFDAQLEEGVWMDQYSPLIFYVGWAYKVGYQLLANDAYKKHAMVIANALKEGITNVPFSKNDTRPEQFQNFVDCWHEGAGDENKFVEWEKGMKLEVLDPLDTWKELRVATVIEVLADGYLKLGFDGEGMEDDCIAIHCASPLLFPVGYCERNGLKLKGPQGGGKFDWKSYLRQSKSITAPEALFDEENEPAAIKNFKIGAKLEAVDMCEPHLICVATVAAHKGRLLQIKYDGWDNSYDQLFDYRSTNIFPLGWCEMNGYKLEAPKTETKKKARSRRK